MPLDSLPDPAAPFDPFVAAGLVQGPNGTYIRPPPDAPTQTSRTVIPVIDVGTPEEGASPGVKPGAMGSQFRPIDVGSTAHPGTALPAAEVFDPFTAAGLVAGPNGSYTRQSPDVTTGAAATPPETASAPPAGAAAPEQELRNQPWYQGLWDTVRSVTSGLPASIEHGATMGFDEVVAPLPAAIFTAITTGKPFTQAYDQAVRDMRAQRQQFETEHPAIGTAAEVAGGLATAPAAGPLFAGARALPTLGTRVLDAARNVAAGTGLGAVAGFGQTEGDAEQRLHGAKQGAILGGALSAVVPAVIGAGGAVSKAVRPSKQVDKITGQMLLEATGGHAPNMQPSPLAGFPLDVGAASNEPGLAALVRGANTMDDAGAVAQRTAQSSAIRDAATTMQPGGTRLATEIAPTEASANIVGAMRRANSVIRDEEERLWTKPTIAAKQLDLVSLKREVDRAITSLPARFQSVIERTADLRATLADLANLPTTATLADVNAVRSELLGLARTLPHDERFAKRVAQTAADAVLKAVESNPALRTDPAAWADYLRARSFTARKWDVLGHDAFQAMLKANRYGNEGIDERTAAGRLFGFSDRTAGERVPQGISEITSMLDDVRRQWGALRAGGVTQRGTLDPATAFAARAELAQGARDFIVNTMLDAASSVQRGTAGDQYVLLNKLSNIMDTNKGWLQRSGLFNDNQVDLWDRIRNAAVVGARTENLRGGSGSETFERLKHDTRFVDLFAAPFVRWGVGAATGGLVGSYLGSLGEVGIGALLGLGAERLGPQLLKRIYEAPRAAVIAKFNEAIRDPQIAEDLMKKATPGNGNKVSPATRAWARSLLALEPSATAARLFSPEATPPALPAPVR